jgi:hypothetical protein
MLWGAEFVFYSNQAVQNQTMGGMKMLSINCPDVHDAKQIAVDYFDSLAREPYTQAERSCIIEECASLLVLLIVACTSADKGSEIGLRVFVTFLRDLSLRVSSHAR